MKKETPEQHAARLADDIRQLYKTNEGPRLIAQMMQEFPHPRKVWNEASVSLPSRWGMRAIDYAR